MFKVALALLSLLAAALLTGTAASQAEVDSEAARKIQEYIFNNISPTCRNELLAQEHEETRAPLSEECKEELKIVLEAARERTEDPIPVISKTPDDGSDFYVVMGFVAVISLGIISCIGYLYMTAPKEKALSKSQQKKLAKKNR